jgi:hypothetical protein
MITEKENEIRNECEGFKNLLTAKKIRLEKLKIEINQLVMPCL